MKSPRLSIAHRPMFLFLILLVSSLLFVSPLPGRAATQQFATGDVFVGLATGDIGWYANSGVSKGTLRTRLNSFVTGMAFNPLGCTGPKVPCLFATNFNANEVTTFDLNGNPTGKFGGPYNSAPESIAFDTSGNVYIGLAVGDKNILKFDQQGNLLAKFNVQVDQKGADWIDLGYEEKSCRILYTSEGKLVKQFDANANTQLSDFASDPLPQSDSRQVLIIPPTANYGTNSGYVLVADDDQIVLLNSSGGQVTTYGPGGIFWFGLALDPDPNFFWGADFFTNLVYKFSFATTGLPSPVISFPSLVGNSVSGLAVYLGPGGTSKGQGCTTSPPGGQSAGRMTGGGSIFTSSGMRVTHGFELHCDINKGPNNLEVNWGAGKKFHLDSLTSASCTDDPKINPNPPAAGFDTHTGTGTGSVNGVPDYTATWIFTDAGEPGTKDTATLTIKDSAGNTVLSVSGNLDKGNNQAHAN